MSLTDILHFCETERDWVVETTTALAREESPTQDKAAVDRCGAELARRLEAIGATVETIAREEVGNLLRATVGDGESQLLVLGHFDTVWPVGQIKRMPIRSEAGRLHGPGVYDMKAGIAIAMLAVRALNSVNDGIVPRKRLVMLWTTDEERGSRSSREVLEEEARHSEAVLVLEPSLENGAVKTGRKGCGEFELTVRGVAAHAGIEPAQGASAVHELAAQIVGLEALQDLQRGVSINVGVVEGGSRPNVVAEQARALVDVRAETAAGARWLQEAFAALRPGLPRTELTVRGGFSRPPLERTAAVVRLYQMAREIAARYGRDLGEGSTGGGSDGNLTAAVGAPTLDGLGAVGAGAHALHEHVEIDHLPWRAAMLAGLIRRLDRT